MPSDQYFGLEITVGNCSIPEYNKNGFTYVESNLFTPVSYSQTVSEVFNGETETQNVPVTPYMIQLTACGPDLPSRYSYYFRVTVDGAKVKGVSLMPGQKKLIKGFRDGLAVRELLFSMPKNSKNLDAKLDPEKVQRIGKVEVECWKAALLDRTWELRQTALNFQQASKQDSMLVTKGSYTMATSKAGRELYQRRIFRNVDQWKRVELLSRQCVHYHMGHTLTAMDMPLRPYPIMATTPTDQATDKPKVKKEEPAGRERAAEVPSTKYALKRHQTPVDRRSVTQTACSSQAKDAVHANTAVHTDDIMDHASVQGEDIMAKNAEKEGVVTVKQEGTDGLQNKVVERVQSVGNEDIEIVQMLDKKKQPEYIDLT